jgi:hypothetical protein
MLLPCLPRELRRATLPARPASQFARHFPPRVKRELLSHLSVTGSSAKKFRLAADDVRFEIAICDLNRQMPLIPRLRSQLRPDATHL